MTSKMPLSQI